jgi:hypothetical protein
MKTALSLTLIVCLVGSALPVAAQGQTALKGASRYRDARLVAAQGRGERIDEVKGVLVSDPQARRIRFEVNDRAVFDVSYDQVTAMHYEESDFPKRSFFRSSYYLIVHYSDAASQGKFETVRLVSTRDVPSMLATLEADTRLRIDRSASKRSFLGLPIYVAVGDTVYVTDPTGQRLKGTLTQLSRSSLRLAASATDRSAVPRDFDQASIRKVEVANLRWTFWGSNNNLFTGIGVTAGLILGVLAAVDLPGDPLVTLLGVTTSGGFLGYLADRHRTRDVYRAP